VNSTPIQAPFSAVVLAGERPGGSKFSQELGLPAGVLVDVDGKTALERVIGALEASGQVHGGVLCGPAADLYSRHDAFRNTLAGSSFSWIEPRSGPSMSALAGIEAIGRFPVLLTAGDHALLTPVLVDYFLTRAAEHDADVVFGLTPYELVRTAYPGSRRTVLRFRGEAFCGSNLFAVLNAAGMAGPRFWSELEADRKKPWRMARRLGWGMLLRYLARSLTLEQALERLSRAMGCRVACVRMNDPRAAVDVDSVADRDLAERILRAERGA
jgi:molybdopterin-guanine dinucleotide biosynthesis protein A